MLKYTQRKLKNKAINYVDNYVPLGFTLGDFSESLKVDSPIKSIELDYNSNSNSNSDNDNDSQYDVQLYNRITTKILNHRRNHILEDVNNNSDSNADIDIDLDSEDTTIEFNIPSNNKFIIDNELFISGVSLLNISLNSDIILSNPTNIHRLVSQSISKIINSIVTDNNNNDIMNSIFSSLDDSIKLNILKLYLQDKQLTSQIIVEDSKDHTFPSQSLQELVVVFINTLYTFSMLLYTNFGIPLISFFVTTIIRLNEEYNFLETLLSLVIRVLNRAVSLLITLLQQAAQVSNQRQQQHRHKHRHT